MTNLMALTDYEMPFTLEITVKVPLSQPCFDHFFGPCFRGHNEAGLLAFSMSLFSDVGPLEAIAGEQDRTEVGSKAPPAVAKSTPKAAKLRCAFSQRSV